MGLADSNCTFNEAPDAIWDLCVCLMWYERHEKPFAYLSWSVKEVRERARALRQTGIHHHVQACLAYQRCLAIQIQDILISTCTISTYGIKFCVNVFYTQFRKL